MARRDAVRTPHRTYVKAQDELIKLAGAMVDEDDNQCGSLYLFEARDEQQVRDWLSKEPFVQGDVYRDIVVRRINLAHCLLPQTDWNQ